MTYTMLYVPMVDSLQDIVDGTASWSPYSTAKAKALLLAITQFEFLMAFVVCRNGLRFVQPLSIGLQGRSNDICWQSLTMWCQLSRTAAPTSTA